MQTFLDLLTSEIIVDANIGVNTAEKDTSRVWMLKRQSLQAAVLIVENCWCKELLKCFFEHVPYSRIPALRNVNSLNYGTTGTAEQLIDPPNSEIC